MISQATWDSQFGNCEPGEHVSITIVKEDGSEVSFDGTVEAAGKDGSYEIPITMEDEGTDEAESEVPIKQGKLDKPKKGKPSRAAAAVLEG